MSGLRHGGRVRDEQGAVARPGGAEDTAARGHSDEPRPATVAGALRLAAGVSEDERPLLVRRLARLDAQLARYRADRVDLELSVEGRGTRSRRLTLECWIAGRPRLVASSADDDLDVAVGRVREGMRRQLDDTATRREPRNNRRLRRSTRTGPRTAVPGRDGSPVDAPPATSSPEVD